MAVAQRPGLFTPKPTDTLVAEAEERGQSLKRVVGVLDLSALGLGAIIGTGIFVSSGRRSATPARRSSSRSSSRA
jgi:APA family basic amino acid/polyamine antiporter